MDNQGKPWGFEEDANLLNEFNLGMSCAQISELHGRTFAAITSRLVKHKKLIVADRAYYPLERPWATFDQLKAKP